MRCSATSDDNVARAHPIIATSLIIVGVEVNRESSSACTDSRSEAPSPETRGAEGPSRSEKTPTICGRTSPSMVTSTAGSAPTIPAAVRSELAATVTAVHRSSSGAETSTEFLNTASTVPGRPSSPGTTRITSALPVASGAPGGTVDTSVPLSSPSIPAATHGTLTRNVSGVYVTSGASTLARLSFCGH